MCYKEVSITVVYQKLRDKSLEKITPYLKNQKNLKSNLEKIKKIKKEISKKSKK